MSNDDFWCAFCFLIGLYLVAVLGVAGARKLWPKRLDEMVPTPYTEELYAIEEDELTTSKSCPSSPSRRQVARQN